MIAKRLDWQRQQRWPFFGEHSGDLPFGRTMNTRFGPAGFPMIKVILSRLETLESESFQRSSFCVAHTALDLSVSVRMPAPAWQGTEP